MQEPRPTVVLVDYGVGNVASIRNMIEFIGGRAVISTKPEEIRNADHIILPGVGAFDHAMLRLRASNLIEAMEHAIFERRVPLLGVCLGMQLLGEGSEEGGEAGLGWVKGHSIKLQNLGQADLKIPNNGWREIHLQRKSALFGKLDEHQKFYFNHGYHLVCDNPNNVAATIEYGRSICCAVQSGQIAGAQFHPEKSHSFGMNLLRRFLALEPA